MLLLFKSRQNPILNHFKLLLYPLPDYCDIKTHINKTEVTCFCKHISHVTTFESLGIESDLKLFNFLSFVR